MHIVTSSAGERKPIRRIALLGNHTPRQCGIATFTADLTSALVSEHPSLDCFVVAMNDPGRLHDYPERVRFQIAEGDAAAYRRAADFLNVNTVDVLCVQHEYGIFGGKSGDSLLPMLRALRMPIVSTLHTILKNPSPDERRVMDELTQLSERLVVMSQRGSELLRSVHGVADHKIDRIPHGIPSLPSAQRSKDRLGVDGKRVILTFGLLSPDKGIEYVIDALPSILRHHPDVIYIVLGATHPHVKERYGETYRLMLEQRAISRGVEANMIFHDRFVSEEEIAEFLAAADVYVTPYLKEEQSTSGTLAYAVGCGKAVVSTPYWYARELLADGRGILVPWRDPEAIAREIVSLLGDTAARDALCQRAAAHGRDMGWPAVARGYFESFERARHEHSERRRTAFQAKTLAGRPLELPDTNLDHLTVMTDHTGMLQHAAFNVPRYEDGYCLDDNVRALALMALIEEGGSPQIGAVRTLAVRYMAFTRHAFNLERGRFRNFMAYTRSWVEDVGSEDSHGRALWGLGTVVGRSLDPGRQNLAGALFHSALPVAREFTSPRAWAFALLGIDEYLKAFQGDSNVQMIREALSLRLLALFERTSTDDWPWFEDRLTYCNATLAHALIASGSRTGNEQMVASGLRALEWLVSMQRSDEGYFAPIGSKGFYTRGGPRARFDQQPVEAHATVSACIEARRVTGASLWINRARQAFHWFLGQNQLQRPLYDAATGGCRDGLHEDRVNENQGAESTLSFLLALLEMRSFDRVTDIDSRSLGRTLGLTFGPPRQSNDVGGTWHATLESIE